MIHLTPEFVETFTQMAYTALQRYPQDRSRLHQACLMVLDGAVTLADGPGPAQVTSRSIPGRVYFVNGQCQCKGAQHGIARCSHRWAVSLLRHTLTALATAEAHQGPLGQYSVENRDARAIDTTDTVARVCSPEHGQQRNGGQFCVTANR